MRKCVIDPSGAVTPFPHVWEECVGSCHAALANRFDWRRQLSQCHDDLGFRRVRFHGLLNDDMSILTRRSGRTVYSFHNMDLIFDFLLSIGMKPFIELGFMPTALASGAETFFHYRGNVTPPADWDAWGSLVETMTRHLVDRFGAAEVRAWPFEVWNEPNLPFFWTGTREQYFTLYAHAARAIKRIDADIPVGGPSTARNAWIPDLLEYCRSADVPLDFISTHHYPTDDAVDQGGDMEAQMAGVGRDALRRMAEKARAEAGRLPLYYTEWSSSPGSRDAYHDAPYAAAFIVKSVIDVANLVDMYSYWAFSDIFEEEGFASAPFHGGFGLLNIHGIPKPAFRAFQLLRNMGHERLAVRWEGPSSTLEVAATRSDTGISILVSNHDVPRSDIRPETISIELPRHPGFSRAWLQRIDELHSNPRTKWESLGSPEYPGEGAIADLVAASCLEKEVAPIRVAEGYQEITIEIPPHGVASIVLER
jgi:xylan 1,4-beta-xylosidase